MSGGGIGDLHVEFAVTGGLMRGLRANQRMVDVGARFIREACTEPNYRIWSKADEYPVMILEVNGGGRSIAVEVWSVSANGVITLFNGEPEGLSIGKVHLDDGTVVLGVIGEPAEVVGQLEITEYGGWRDYIGAKGIAG